MYNPFSLQGKTILITGASSGIGRAIAVECSKMDATVILTARSKERLQETLSLMNNAQPHQIIIADLDSEKGILEIENSISQKIDGIVHSAGATKILPFQFASKQEFDSIMNINFYAVAELSRLLVKSKKIEKYGSIVFISSISGVFCSAVASSIYSASKGAIQGLMKGMALDLSAKNIRVNSINPGMIETNIFNESTITKEQFEEDVKRYPLKRYGKPEEVAYAAIYLLSDASKWVTGSNLLIDGGYTLL